MKKWWIIISILGLIILVVLWMRATKTPISTEVKTFKSQNIGISFSYPKMLLASTTNESVRIHHEVPFEHHNYCDFKGEGNTTIPTLTDFSVTFHISESGLVETIKTESPYIPAENFINGEIIASPGFIDGYTIGNLKGYKIFEGAEGCGQTTYYFSISKNKTLVVQQELITVFTGAIDTENAAKAEAVPGVLNKERANAVFESMLKTVTVQ